ncbi:hypothetical protein COO91_07580 [Nostoc flagelliforme CCNUN1]|uniref:Uncharacterized protein n=1 Tax=Nostoc flagelliforme CCNUN1 TaxID=2038116 RepID=A0A2K8T1G0_9NOSO|nr:hypothetical protein COO91_07580 [Nostoc flagelliforme CCNUN1]
MLGAEEKKLIFYSLPAPPAPSSPHSPFPINLNLSYRPFN